MSPGAERTVRGAFDRFELLKVKILESSPQSAEEVGNALAASVSAAHLVQVVGRTVVLYRPGPQKPGIELPT